LLTVYVAEVHTLYLDAHQLCLTYMFVDHVFNWVGLWWFK